MPSRISYAPRRIPFELLGIKFRLGKPKYEIRLVFLVFVLLDAISYADLQILLAEIMENIIFLQLRGIKINISSRFVCISLFNQR